LKPGLNRPARRGVGLHGSGERQRDVAKGCTARTSEQARPGHRPLASIVVRPVCGPAVAFPANPARPRDSIVCVTPTSVPGVASSLSNRGNAAPHLNPSHVRRMGRGRSADRIIAAAIKLPACGSHPSDPDSCSPGRSTHRHRAFGTFVPGVAFLVEARGCRLLPGRRSSRLRPESNLALEARVNKDRTSR